jgi:hypothetical protein
MEPFKKRSARYLLLLLATYALLVATHEGEFWPFSIYPMFSKAGKPWTRAIVREVSSTPDTLKWKTTNLDDLYGSPVALKKHGVDQIDFANFVSRTKEWSPKRRHALKLMFGEENIKNHEFMVMKVTGQFVNRDSVITTATPLFLLTEDTVFSNPSLDLNSTELQGND